jgi:DNA-directed RNA polymerase subunit RPC12/RpoP
MSIDEHDANWIDAMVCARRLTTEVYDFECVHCWDDLPFDNTLPTPGQACRCPSCSHEWVEPEGGHGVFGRRDG